MKTRLKQYLFVLAFAAGFGSECGAADEVDSQAGDVSIHTLAPALLQNMPPSELLKLIDGRQGVVRVETTPAAGVKVNGISVSPRGVAFSFKDGGQFPLLRFPVPNPSELSKAETMSELLKLFLPATSEGSAEQKFFHKMNLIAIAEVHLSAAGVQSAHRLGAVYVQDGRLIGISCYLWYYPTDKPKGLDSKIEMLSVDMWISKDLSKLP
jgi:hypothetical protein